MINDIGKRKYEAKKDQECLQFYIGWSKWPSLERTLTKNVNKAGKGVTQNLLEVWNTNKSSLNGTQCVRGWMQQKSL